MMRRQGGTDETGGGPAGERAQDAGRGGAAAEIEDGAAVDAIAASIRPTAFLRADPREGESPESADDLFTAHIHGLVDLRREVEAQAAEWAEGQEPGAENHTARFVVESLRALLVRQMSALAAREEPPSPDEIACLALALHRIEVVDKRRLEGERAAGVSAATQAPRKHPSTEEMRALLGPAIKAGFHPERLGSKPWEPWPDAPAPAEPDAAPPEPWPDPSDAPYAWGEPEAQDVGHVRGAHDLGHVRGAHDLGHVRGAHDLGGARDAHVPEDAHEERDPEDAREAPGKGAACEEDDANHARGAQDVGHARGSAGCRPRARKRTIRTKRAERRTRTTFRISRAPIAGPGAANCGHRRSPSTPRDGEGRGRALTFSDPRRRARAPLACLRAIRRGAQSRAPDLRSGTLHPCSFPSGGGRELRSLAYAPKGAARGRALRTCGPALFALVHFPQAAGGMRGAKRGAAGPSP